MFEKLIRSCLSFPLAGSITLCLLIWKFRGTEAGKLLWDSLSVCIMWKEQYFHQTVMDLTALRRLILSDGTGRWGESGAAA